MRETAKIAEPISGDKLYQQRARAALPLLVRQARAEKEIYYSDLALELSMPNPRNLNYPLGSIGQAIELLSDQWGETIPPIQCVVINKNTGLPGEGIGWFITKQDEFHALPRRQQRMLVQAELQRVYAYPKWSAVLNALGLSEAPADYASALSKAASFRGGGEGEQHRRLKEYVAAHPEILNLPASTEAGTTEFPLPSGDTLDVLFKTGDDWTIVEVKSAVSGKHDLIRGMFQCVKYQAVAEAYQAAQDIPRSVRTVLLFEDELPEDLLPLKHVLGTEIIDAIQLQ